MDYLYLIGKMSRTFNLLLAEALAMCTVRITTLATETGGLS